jgi:hypothetical protein
MIPRKVSKLQFSKLTCPIIVFTTSDLIKFDGCENKETRNRGELILKVTIKSHNQQPAINI